MQDVTTSGKENPDANNPKDLDAKEELDQSKNEGVIPPMNKVTLSILGNTSKDRLFNRKLISYFDINARKTSKGKIPIRQYGDCLVTCTGVPPQTEIIKGWGG